MLQRGPASRSFPEGPPSSSRNWPRPVALRSMPRISPSRVDRLSGLSADALRLVEAAAIGDGHLRMRLLEQVTDLEGDELDRAIQAAATAGVLDERPSHDELAFAH